jgi:hypothetical protein
MTALPDDLPDVRSLGLSGVILVPVIVTGASTSDVSACLRPQVAPNDRFSGNGPST